LCAFKHLAINACVLILKIARKHQTKKREMRLNISQRLPPENKRQLQSHYPKNILRTSVDTLDGGATIHAPRHD
jgi:adenylate kinase